MLRKKRDCSKEFSNYSATPKEYLITTLRRFYDENAKVEEDDENNLTIYLSKELSKKDKRELETMLAQRWDVFPQENKKRYYLTLKDFITKKNFKGRVA